MTPSQDSAILIAAAGRGSRVGTGIPKQYRNLAGLPLLARTIESLARAAPKSALLPIIHKDDLTFYEACMAAVAAKLSQRVARPVFGGATRQESVRRGLEALTLAPLPPKIVLIHD